MSEVSPNSFAAMLDAQAERRRAFEDRIGGRVDGGTPSPEASPVADDALEGGEVAASASTPLDSFSGEERALVEDRAAKGDPTALALVEGREAKPRTQGGDGAARRSPRQPKSAASAFNKWTRDAIAARKAMSGLSGRNYRR